jgi:hypothetical protein
MPPKMKASIRPQPRWNFERAAGEPIEQLKLVHAEVVRQRATVLQRTNNMYTRAAILVTASGVFSTVPGLWTLADAVEWLPRDSADLVAGWLLIFTCLR